MSSGTVTLALLKTYARQRADMVNSDFIAEDELTQFINGSAAELYDLIVSRYEDYYITSEDVTISSGNTIRIAGSVSIVPGFAQVTGLFYKLKGIDVQEGSDWLPLKPFNFANRNRFTNSGTNAYGGQTRVYRMVGANLEILPTDNANGVYRVWYIPAFPSLVSEADTMDSMEQWFDFIVIDAAIKMKQKQEDDVSVLMQQKAEMTRRILNMSANRDAGASEHVTDVQGIDADALGCPWR